MLDRLARPIAAIAAALCIAAPACGQFGGELPDPIPSAALDEYAKRLGLSDAQRRAIAHEHARYREAYAALRDGPLAEYASAHGGMLSWFASAQDVEAGDKALTEVLSRIRTVDESLFDGIVPVLTDAQRERLAGLRLARERTRILAVDRGAAFLVPAVRLDLAKMVDGLELSAAVRDAAAPVIVQHEHEFTAAVRRLHESVFAQQVALAEARAALRASQEATFESITGTAAEEGDAPATGGETETADEATPAEVPDEARMEEIRAAMEDLQRDFEAMRREHDKGIAREALEAAAVARRTLRALDAVLPHDQARTLRHGYLRRAYRELPRLPGPAERLIDDALDDETIDEAARARLEELRDVVDASTAPILESMMNAADEHRRAGGRSWGGSDDDPDRATYEAKLSDLRERWRKANDDVITAVAEISPAQREQAEAARAAMSGSDKVSMVSVIMHEMPGMGTTLFVHARSLTMPPGALRPLGGTLAGGAISQDDLDRYERVLGLDDGGKAVLRMLYDDYRDQYDATVAPTRSSLATARPELWRVEGETLVTPEVDAIDRAHELERSVRSAMRAVDDQFFDDVGLAVVEPPHQPRLERLRLARERDRIGPGGIDGDHRSMMLFGGRVRSMGSRNAPALEAGIALDALTDDLELDDAARDAVEPILGAYVASAAGHARARATASLRFQAALERTVATTYTGDSRMPTQLGDDTPLDQATTDGDAATAAREALLALNRQTRDELRSALPPESAEALRRAYRTAVYPRIYRDRKGTEPLIADILAMDDITADQRSRVADLAIDYREQYEAMSKRMVEIEEADARLDPSSMGTDMEKVQARMAEMQERRRLGKQLRFDRDDLSARVASELRMILTEPQRERLDAERARPTG